MKKTKMSVKRRRDELPRITYAVVTILLYPPVLLERKQLPSIRLCGGNAYLMNVANGAGQISLTSS